MITDPGLRELLRMCRDEIDALLTVYENLDNGAEEVAEQVASRAPHWRGLRDNCKRRLER